MKHKVHGGRANRGGAFASGSAAPGCRIRRYSPSPEYAETRGFYAKIGYLPLEVFPELWGPRLPVLQLVKTLHA